MKIGSEFEVAGVRLHCGVINFSGYKFVIGTDRSIQPYGNEIRTPPLSFSELGIMKNVFRWLKEQGGYSNSSCGMHIHLDKPPDFNVQRLKESFKRYLPLIERSFKPRRLRAEYCSLKNFGHKYCAIHLHPQGTIEFRLFNGCLDYRQYIRCVRLCIKISYSEPPVGAG